MSRNGMRLWKGLGIATMVMVAGLLSKDAGASPKHVVIAIAGDSTVETTPDSSDHHGWGQYLQGFFDKDVEVLNFAKGGRSTKTFLEEGRWKELLKSHPDYVLIQFGHNDSHTPDHHEHTDANVDFRANLELMVDEARAAHAIPILITPVMRRAKVDNLVPYADVVQEVATERKVALIDLHRLSAAYYATLSKDELAGLQAGGTDVTHFNVEGAKRITVLVAQQLIVVAPELAARVRRP